MSSAIVIISVGTDHHPFDRLVSWAVRWASDHPDCKVIIQRGTSATPPGVESHELIPHAELQSLFRCATAVVSHGGPSTLMDARMAGRLPIVVPRDPRLGEHVDDHQIRFADHLARHGMARVARTEAEFRAALADVLEHPDNYAIPVQETALSSGVVRFGEMVDGLLGVTTKLRLHELAGSDERQHPDRRETERRTQRRRAQADEAVSNAEASAVSVVIATRDRPELLRRAVEAVLDQEHAADLEVIVVFDRSEPDLSIQRSGGNRTVIVTTNDRSPGLAGARNSGVAKASHDWIAFCDDDDEWLPGKLAAQFRAIDAAPGARVATTGVFIHYQGSDTPRIPMAERLTYDGFLEDRMTEVHPSATLVARSVIDEMGDVDEQIPGGYAEDYDWLMRAAQVSPIAVAPQPLVRVYWHGASFFFERWKTIDEALEYLIAKHPRFERHPRGLARIRGQQAVARAAMGQRKAALRTAWTSFRLSPTERRVPVALVCAAGIPAGLVLRVLHRFGKGI